MSMWTAADDYNVVLTFALGMIVILASASSRCGDRTVLSCSHGYKSRLVIKEQ